MIVKASVAQVGSVPFNSAANIEKAEAWIAKASAAGSEIVVFPETFVSGYSTRCVTIQSTDT